MKTKILILASNPAGTDQLQLNPEIRSIKDAQEKYQELKINEQEQARHIFLQLVNPGEDNNHTRRRVNREQIGDKNWDLVTRKDGLADSRLVVTSRSSDDRETLEVVHEALIRHWSRLQKWFNEGRVNLDKQRRIENAAQVWKKSGKEIYYLLFDERLREAKEFQKEQQANYPLSDLASNFVLSSSKHQRDREREKRNSNIGFLVTFLLVPLISTVLNDPQGVALILSKIVIIAKEVVREINLNDDKRLIQNIEKELKQYKTDDLEWNVDCSSWEE